MEAQMVTSTVSRAEAPPPPEKIEAPKRTLAVSAVAVEAIRRQIAKRGTPDAAIRVGVRGGGCSGLSYVMEFAYGANPDDTVVEVGDVRFFVDPKSGMYLDGTELDYVEGVMGSGFEFKNPNVKRSCACGESVAV